MSQNNSSSIFIDYDGEEFPNSSQHALAGYYPDSVFLSHDDAKSPNESLHINQTLEKPEDLQDFFVKLSERPRLIFRYQNKQVSRSHREKRRDEDIDKYRTAPVFSFGEAETRIELSENLINQLDSLDEILREYGVNEIGLCCDWENFSSVEHLESELNNPRIYMRPKVQGLASVEYSWNECKAEINLYSEELNVNNLTEYGESFPVDMRRNKSNETVMYIRDGNAVQNIRRELENIFETVETEVLPNHVLPEDVRREL